MFGKVSTVYNDKLQSKSSINDKTLAKKESVPTITVTEARQCKEVSAMDDNKEDSTEGFLCVPVDCQKEYLKARCVPFEGSFY